MSKDKELALKLLQQKRLDFNLSYSDIANQTGYTKRQLIRMFQKIERGDMDSLLTHGNAGKKPVITASDQEISYLRKFKEPYPVITITQFRDFFIEEVLSNPSAQKDVQEFSLKPRSLSWFRQLYKKEGWKSPASRKPRRDKRSQHPLRDPAQQRGMLVQIDGTPFDWFQNGEMWTLHLAVDDATSEVLAGHFYPTERQLGYCQIVRLILKKHGIPMALYSDRHSIFRNSNDDEPTQFGMMMQDLGIELILANTSQAKGRVERYNKTAQSRLVNDIVRFGIKNYDELNIWFNDFYLEYLNKKFAFMPKDLNDAFVPLDSSFDQDSIFCLRYVRKIKKDMFSLFNCYYSIVDENGEVVHIIDDTEVKIRISVFTDKMFVIRYGKKYDCFLRSDRKHKPQEIMNNQKDITDFLNSRRKKQ